MSKRTWERSAAIVRTLPGEVILKAAGHCSGHNILDPKAFSDAGIPAEVVEYLTRTYKSDGSPRVRCLQVASRSNHWKASMAWTLFASSPRRWASNTRMRSAADLRQATSMLHCESISRRWESTCRKRREQ